MSVPCTFPLIVMSVPCTFNLFDSLFQFPVHLKALNPFENSSKVWKSVSKYVHIWAAHKNLRSACLVSGVFSESVWISLSPVSPVVKSWVLSIALAPCRQTKHGRLAGDYFWTETESQRLSCVLKEIYELNFQQQDRYLSFGNITSHLGDEGRVAGVLHQKVRGLQSDRP